MSSRKPESLLTEVAEGWRGSRVGRLGQESRFVSVAFEMPIQGDARRRRQGTSLDLRSKVWISSGIVPSKEESHETKSKLEGVGFAWENPAPVHPPVQPRIHQTSASTPCGRALCSRE